VTEDKTRYAHDVWAAWGGVPGLQTMLPVLLTEGVRRRGMPLPLLVRLTSTNPARQFGLGGLSGVSDCVPPWPAIGNDRVSSVLRYRFSQ
jgi:dihydroorotase-like cyclic amidohydrolase